MSRYQRCDHMLGVQLEHPVEVRPRKSDRVAQFERTGHRPGSDLFDRSQSRTHGQGQVKMAKSASGLDRVKGLPYWRPHCPFWGGFALCHFMAFERTVLRLSAVARSS